MDAASDFFGEVHVPKKAITMGVATILEVGVLAASAVILAAPLVMPASRLWSTYAVWHHFVVLVCNEGRGRAARTQQYAAWQAVVQVEQDL